MANEFNSISINGTVYTMQDARVDDLPIVKADTEEEFNALIVETNVGKVISYGGNLYVVSAKKTLVTPQLGDVLTDLYFDTSVTPNFEGYSAQILCILGRYAGSTDNKAGLLAVQTPIQWKMFSDTSATAQTDVYLEVYGGWKAEHITLDNLTVTIINDEEFWQGWVSKEPITTTIEAVKVGGSEYPQEWQSGTSGSIQLPSKGRYELVATISGRSAGYTGTTTINWNGGNYPTISTAFCFMDEGEAWYWYFSIDTTGVLTANQIVGGDTTHPSTSGTISYRKIGEA